jgi:hypothetical protein
VPSVSDTWTAAFSHGLCELGWIEGRTIAIKVRWAEGHSERYAGKKFRSAGFCFHKPGPEGNRMHCIIVGSTLERSHLSEEDTCHMPIN